MLKIRFNSDHDEIKFFVQLKEIQMFSDTKIKCAMLVKDEDPSHRAPDEDPSHRAPDEDPSHRAPDEDPSHRAPDSNLVE